MMMEDSSVRANKNSQLIFMKFELDRKLPLGRKVVKEVLPETSNVDQVAISEDGFFVAIA